MIQQMLAIWSLVCIDKEKNLTLVVCFLLPLKEKEEMSGTCSLFPRFGDPWPSCLLPSQYPSWVTLWWLGPPHDATHGSLSHMSCGSLSHMSSLFKALPSRKGCCPGQRTPIDTVIDQLGHLMSRHTNTYTHTQSSLWIEWWFANSSPEFLCYLIIPQWTSKRPMAST